MGAVKTAGGSLILAERRRTPRSARLKMVRDALTIARRIIPFPLPRERRLVIHDSAENVNVAAQVCRDLRTRAQNSYDCHFD